jgi:fluoride exporter
MSSYLWVAIGGAIGSVARYWLAALSVRHWGETFPWGILIVNVSGSFLIGLFGALTAPDGPWPLGTDARLFFMAGVCGGFTTFSAFSLQTLSLLENRQWLYAGANIVASVVLCLVAVWLGHMLAGMAKPGN